MGVSPENPFDWEFLKVGSVVVYSFIKNVPNIQDYKNVGPPQRPAPLRALTIKGVYEVDYSWYG